MIYQRIVKRFFDFAFSLILLVFLSPLLLSVACSIIVVMGRPIFFVHERPGIHKKPFCLIKFRTMKDQKGLSDEERITKLGSFLRKTSID